MSKAHEIRERIIRDLTKEQRPQERSMLSLMKEQLGGDAVAESMAKEILRELAKEG